MTNVPAGAAFFAALRPLFGGKLSQPQVDGINLILDAFAKEGDGRATSLAYILATVFHETARTMQPVKETQFGADVPTDALVKQRLTKAWNAGKLPWVKKDYWSGGYFGRGYVQLTHAGNYKKAGDALGVNLGAEPSLALDPGIAVRVLILGMLGGWFTTKKLSDYITSTEFDFRNARRVVNGVESAEKVAGYAEQFLAAIRAAQKANAPAPAAPQPKAPPATPAPIEPHEEPIAPPAKAKFPWWIVGIIAVAAALLAFGIDWS